MALETLKDIDEIDGYDVGHYHEGDIPPVEDCCFISVDHKNNRLLVRIQNGPIKEVGVNGCMVDTIIETAEIMINGLNKKFPCSENTLAVLNLEAALVCMRMRKERREREGNEGHSREREDA